MFNFIKIACRKEAFAPSYFGIFLNPFYHARRNLFLSMVRMSSHLGGSLLDVGCGTMPYRKLFTVKSYSGLDIDSNHNRELAVADDFYDGNEFPYADAQYDSVLCNQVLEHVFNPDHFLLEINRVLKPNGKLLLSVPFVWDEHEQPHDFARYSSFGLCALLEKNGFKIIIHEKLGADASTLFQLMNAYLFKVSQHMSGIFQFALMVTVMAGINILGMLFARFFPKNNDLFLDQVVLAERVKDWQPYSLCKNVEFERF
jgi:SAM-dependent methyltransferase